jgi:hypothetical protein
MAGVTFLVLGLLGWGALFILAILFPRGVLPYPAYIGHA